MVTKSAEWIVEDIANINFKIESNLGLGKTKSDFIFVIEDSSRTGMLNQEQQNAVFSVFELFYLITTPGFMDESSNISLITFNSAYNVIGDFTRDVDTLLGNAQNSLTLQGNTNYYQALRGVDEVLSDYTKEEEKDCTVVFITFGEPNEQTPEEQTYMEQLRSKYPYLKLNSIGMFFAEGESTQSLINISDNTYIEKELSDSIELSFITALDVTRYNSFVIEDTINSKYFDVIEATSDIGKITINDDLENTKVNWNLGENYFSGSVKELNIKIKLKDEYTSDLGIFQTNIQETITSQIGMVSESVTSSLTPVITNGYLVTYDSNSPEECTVENYPDPKLYKAFSTVEIDDNLPTCSGYKFKGWKIVEDDVTKMNDHYFIMPKHDVTLKAEWAKVSVKKTMSGNVTEVKPLYDVLASSAVLDNKSSTYVTSSKGINFSLNSSDTNGKGLYLMASTANDEYPIYYYRGDVDNNNVKFANFCWKIVRTTDTGGIKLLYNGLPNETGGCSNTTGESTVIGSTEFASSFNNLSHVGYMYGEDYLIQSKDVEWYALAGLPTYASVNSGTLYYSDNATYSGGTYILENPVEAQLSDVYNQIAGKYTCSISKGTTCSTLHYIIEGVSDIQYNRAELSGGQTRESVENSLGSYMFGTNVEYVEGKYYLTNSFSILGKDISSNISNILGTYTCLNNTNSCDKIYYIIGASQSNTDSNAQYIEISNGKNFADVISEKVANENSSLAKQYIESWYEENLQSYTDKLEDIIWCNDRSVYGITTAYEQLYTINEKVLSLTFSPVQRLINGTPSLNCNFNDSFTADITYKNGIQIGNAALNYPIGLLTTDEAMLAGMIKPDYRRDGVTNDNINSSTYLYNGLRWWLISPGIALGTLASNTQVADSIDFQIPGSKAYIRPSISLKNGTILFGSGTVDNPYQIEEFKSS